LATRQALQLNNKLGGGKKAMPATWRIELQERAEVFLSRFVQANPGYSVDDDQPECRGGTHFITYGSFHGQPVVFKYFCVPERKEHERTALELFAPTRLVPRLYPIETDLMLVMERLRGSTFHMAEGALRQEQVQHLYYQLGQAMALIAEIAPGSVSGGQPNMTSAPGYDYEFYCKADLPTFFDTVTERSAKVLAKEYVPERTILEKSLSALVDNRDAILSYPSFIQMDDFHTSNIMADGPELTGFIDLEMTRYGNEVLLLGAGLAMMRHGRPERWSWIREGYEGRRGRHIDSDLLSLACIAAPLSQWIRFMWYWTTEDVGALEPGARGWPVRDIKAIAETVGNMQP
jgi:hypothetical protein